MQIAPTAGSRAGWQTTGRPPPAARSVQSARTGSVPRGGWRSGARPSPFQKAPRDNWAIARQKFAIKVCQAFSYKVLSAAVLRLAMCGTAFLTCCHQAIAGGLAWSDVIDTSIFCWNNLLFAAQNALVHRDALQQRMPVRGVGVREARSTIRPHCALHDFLSGRQFGRFPSS